MIGSGTLPLGWVWVRIDEVSNVGTGATPLKGNPKYYELGTVSWVTSGLLNELFITKVEEKITELAVKETNAKVFPKHTLLVAMYGEGKTRGKVSELLVEAATNQACAALVFDGEASKLRPFVKLFLQKNYNDIRRLSSGGVQPNLNLGIIKATKVPIPPLNEQRRIVAKIEALKARSQRVKEELEAIPALLDQFRQSVLAAAFRGDLTADWREKNPDVEPASVLLERIRAERRRRWEEAELEKMKAQGKTPKDDKWKEKYKEPEPVDTTLLPELAEGWCWASLDEVSAIQGGIQKQPKRIPNKNAYPFLRVANVPRGRLNLEDVHQIELFSGELEKLRLVKGDLLVVEGNGSPSEIGRTAIWDGSIKDCVHQNHLIRVRLSESLKPEFIEAYWNSPQGRAKVFEVAHTTTGLYTLSVSKIAILPIPLAPEAEQIILQQKLDKLFQIEAYMQTLMTQGQESLNSLDRSILAKAFRGELVPQDANDEPASVLLERIRAEREKLNTRKKAKGKTEKKSRKAKPEAAEPEQLSLPGFE